MMNMWVESSRPKSLSMATHHQSERIAHSENTYAACDESDETHDAVMAEIDLPRCQYDLESEGKQSRIYAYSKRETFHGG